MTQGNSATPTGAPEKQWERRVRALEAAVLVFPITVIEILLVFGLLVPFATDTIDGEEQSVNLFGLVGGFFAPDESGEADSSAVPFGVAFVVLIAVIVGVLLTLPWLARREISTGAQRAVITFVVLLIAGTVGAWMVMGMGLSAHSPWSIKPALPLLSAGTLLATLLAFQPSYRDVWKG
jgi:ABC-type amino acid transport system permease subunit